MTPRLPIVLSLLPWLLCACATDQQFAPREHGNGTGPTGRPAALYPLAAPAAGEVRLWSDGARRAATADGEQTVLHLGFELENTGASAWVLDAADVRVAGVRGADDAELPAPVRRSGATVEAPAGATARSDHEFVFAGDVAPRSLAGFTVHWSVRAGDQVWTQVTPFEPWRRYAEYGYDPWPWWGFGFGFGWHHCR